MPKMQGMHEPITIRQAPPIGTESIWGTPEVPAAAHAVVGESPIAQCPHARCGCSAWENGACLIGGCEATLH